MSEQPGKMAQPGTEPPHNAGEEAVAAGAQNTVHGSVASAERLIWQGPWLVVALLGLSGLGVASSALMWQKLSHIQTQLARQSADSGQQATEARALARQAMDMARESAARQALLEARVSEVSLQRTQLDELIQSLSRSRDENLVVDLDSSLRLAAQQAQLTGSLEPLVAALRTADQRLARSAQPRLVPLRRAVERDLERVRTAVVPDMPNLLSRLDELVRSLDDLPLANGAPVVAPRSARPASAAPAGWWERSVSLVGEEARRLVRVGRIDQPEAALISPEQSFFLRENLKLKVLNARLGLMARQYDSVRSDLTTVQTLVVRYADPAARKSQQTVTTVQQLLAQLRSAELPRLDETFAALATAAAGR